MPRSGVALLLLAVVWPGAGCNGGRAVPVSREDSLMRIELTSPDFVAGQPMPRVVTGEGEDRSPHLRWSQPPPGTRELALICDDPDAPSPQPWVHWVLYDLAPDVSELPGGLPKAAQLTEPLAARQGKNSWPSGQTIGYRGPLPPPGHGVHHYHFRLYALDTPLDVPPGCTQDELLRRMQGHVLATGELVGTYAREK
ncbi:MAG: YbhB/YbcL family Raf kinase inhibitor-like protein [Pirellulaceae bacterium]|jgi:hypothetical protein|nr:YbhB/YbcL family Raf kinase inhibitor-like protein [Pirellulaceae bacterium]